MAVILGIETSGLEGLIALKRDGVLLSELMLDRTKRRHAQTLVSEVQQLLSRHAVKPAEVEVVAVSRGPGSFTGLRVGVVFAKTFAFATGCRLVAVDTLQAAAATAPAEIHEVSAVADAMRDELFVGRYRRVDASIWERVGAIVIQRNDEWLQAVENEAGPGFAVTGPGLVKLSSQIPTVVRQLESESWTPRAAAICDIGERMAAQGEFADSSSLEPFYLRKSAAEEKRDAVVA